MALSSHISDHREPRNEPRVWLFFPSMLLNGVECRYSFVDLFKQHIAHMSKSSFIQKQVTQTFADVLKGIESSFVITDPRSTDHPILYASQEFYTLTGYSAKEVLGRNCRFLQGKHTSATAIAELRSAISEERQTSVVILNYTKDRVPFWNALSIYPIHKQQQTQSDPDQAPPQKPIVEFFIGVQANCTRLIEQHLPTTSLAAEEQLQAAHVAAQIAKIQQEMLSQTHISCTAHDSLPSSLVASISKLQDCFVLADPGREDMVMVYCSPAFLRMTGYACHELIGRNCRILQHHPKSSSIDSTEVNKEELDKLRAALAADPPRAVTVTLLNFKKDGTPFWNCLHVSPARDADGKVQFFIGVQSDITDYSSTQVSKDGGKGEVAKKMKEQKAAAAKEEEEEKKEKEKEEEDETPTLIDQNGLLLLPKMKVPSHWDMLKPKALVASVRVSTRSLAPHGLRRKE